MDKRYFDYYASHENWSFSNQQNLITYSFNNVERTIVGEVREKDDLIYLYEYRGKYIGTEFFISFSKKSATYKLIKVSEVAPGND